MRLPKKNLTGHKFDHLTVVEFAGRRGCKAYWKCQCDCPQKTFKIVESYNLTSGHSTTCDKNFCEWNLTPRLSDLPLTTVESPLGRDWVSFQAQTSMGVYKTVVVDREDIQRLAPYRWTLCRSNNTYYVNAWIKNPLEEGINLQLHRIILRLDYGDTRQGDHYNGSGLDNTKRIDGIGNLLIVTAEANKQNKFRSRNLPRGVYPYRDRWKAVVMARGKNISLGIFPTIAEAESAAIEGRKVHLPHSNPVRKNINIGEDTNDRFR